MFEISDQTFSTFERAEEEKFVGRMAAFLREKLPYMADEPDEELRGEIRKLKKQANSYGLTTERTVATYVLTAAHLGLDFVDKFDGARKILFRAAGEQRKADLLEAYTLDILEKLATPL